MRDKPSESASDIRSSYAEWLQEYNWDYFCTVTFRLPRVNPQPALNVVWKALQPHNVGRAFLAAEHHLVSDNLHIHGILAGYHPDWSPQMSLPWDIWKTCFDRFGRSKIDLVGSHEAVTAYCAKYVLKGTSRADYYGVYGDAFCWKEGKL